MSKSVGNVVDPFNLIDAYGVDQVRFFFMREVPFGNDGSYSHEAIVNRINADLANDLGNLAQRSLSMVFKNCEGKLAPPENYTSEDNEILSLANAMHEQAGEAMNRQAIHRMLSVVWNVVGEANKYFAAQEPWALKKTDPERMAAVLYIAAEVVRQVAIMAQPVMPESCAKLLDALGVPEDMRTFAALETPLPETRIDAPSGVFPRYVEKDGAA